MNITTNKVHLGNCINLLKLIQAKSVNTSVSSPPYYNLRDYNIDPTEWPEVTYTLFGLVIIVKPMICCLGLEPTPQDFIGHLIYIYRLVRESLCDDGTIWVNIGDSYAGAKKQRTTEQAIRKSDLKGAKDGQISCANQNNKIFKDSGIKPKDMLGIPWMLAFALREDGWYLRQDIIWHKRNCMPESATDRCTKNHEYIFLLSKSRKYFFDNEAIKTVALDPLDDKRRSSYKSSICESIDIKGNSFLSEPNKYRSPKGWDKRNGSHSTIEWSNENQSISKAQSFKRHKSHHQEPIPGQSVVQHRPDRKETEPTGYANKRSVWSIATQGFKEAHFATFPKKLIVDCIKAGTSEYGHCASCSKPYYRMVESELIPGPIASFNTQIDNRDINADSQDAGSNRVKDGHKPGWVKTQNTTGWKKSCKCDTDQVKRGVVLDMFSGSGTTAIVSIENHRDFIAIEQSEKYIKISDRRMHRELGIFNPNK